MSRIKKLFIPALALVLSVPALSAAGWKIPRTHYYLTAEQQQFPEFPPPPADGSKTDLAERAVLHEWQVKRTDEQCSRADSEAAADYSPFFGDLSPFPRPLPAAAAAVLKRVKKETDGIAANVKDKFKRPRPFTRDTGLKPCLGRIGGLSYPSGHAAIARVYALILSDLVPEHRAQFLARTDEAALYRVIAGVHYPSDIEAGKKLADTLYPMYLRSPEFRADMKTLRGYLLRAPAGSPQ